MTMFVVFVCN